MEYDEVVFRPLRVAICLLLHCHPWSDPTLYDLRLQFCFNAFSVKETKLFFLETGKSAQMPFAIGFGLFPRLSLDLIYML